MSKDKRDQTKDQPTENFEKFKNRKRDKFKKKKFKNKKAYLEEQKEDQWN
jgi:hypothetical protein